MQIRWAHGLVACLALGCGADREAPSGNIPETDHAPPTSSPTTTAPRPSRDARTDRRPVDVETHEAQLTAVDKAIEGAYKLSRTNKTTLPWEKLATAYMTRAKLTGALEDYAEAEKALEIAFGKKDGYGPWLTRAKLNFTLHRMDRVDADLARAKKVPTSDPVARAELLAFEGKVAFQRGEYEKARKLTEASLALRESYTGRVTLALQEWKTGNFDRAEQLFSTAGDDYHATPTEPIAWIHLMLGLMDLERGRYDEALAHYREGEKLIEGYWLTEEHIAEILKLQGKTNEAKRMYEDIIARTDNPEFMDALAGILLEEGKETEAQAWIRKARARYEDRLARFPEAAYGHALEHVLAFDEDPSRAVDMAEKNHDLRPNAEAKILLARAYLKAGRVADAEKRIQEALTSPWNTAELHAVAAEVFHAAGKTKTASREATLARALDPKISIAFEATSAAGL